MAKFPMYNCHQCKFVKTITVWELHKIPTYIVTEYLLLNTQICSVFATRHFNIKEILQSVMPSVFSFTSFSAAELE